MKHLAIMAFVIFIGIELGKQIEIPKVESINATGKIVDCTIDQEMCVTEELRHNIWGDQ